LFSKMYELIGFLETDSWVRAEASGLDQATNSPARYSLQIVQSG